MRVNQEQAYVLHHHDYGETSLLLEIFARRHDASGLSPRVRAVPVLRCTPHSFPFSRW